MDIQAAKIDLIQWLTELKDAETLKQLKAIKEGQDWWDQISQEERIAIDQGLDQLDKGEGISHHAVLKEVPGKYQL